MVTYGIKYIAFRIPVYGIAAAQSYFPFILRILIIYDTAVFVHVYVLCDEHGSTFLLVRYETKAIGFHSHTDLAARERIRAQR